MKMMSGEIYLFSPILKHLSETQVAELEQCNCIFKKEKKKSGI